MLDKRNLFKVNARAVLSDEGFAKAIEEAEKRINRLRAKCINMPSVCVLKTSDDPASKKYIKYKTASFEKYGILTEVKETYDIKSFLECRTVCSSLIPQLPLGENFKSDYRLLIPLKISDSADIDRLLPSWKDMSYMNKPKYTLPVTSYVLYDLLCKIKGDEDRTLKVYLRGNGPTTNRGLFSALLETRGIDVRISNSKTSKTENEDCIMWADVIVSATGIPESLSCYDKIVISPTIAKVGEHWCSDLSNFMRNTNITHKVLGAIGKLTVLGITERVILDHLYNNEKAGIDIYDYK